MLKGITAPTIVTCVQQEAAARKAAAFFDIHRTRDFNIRNRGSNIHAANVRRTKKDESPYSVSNAIRTLVMKHCNTIDARISKFASKIKSRPLTLGCDLSRSKGTGR